MKILNILFLATLLFALPAKAEVPSTDYETVAASQTAQVLGPVGGQGDILERLIIIPETTGAGTVALLDGSTSINVFIAGTLSDLKPINIPIGARSTTGAWKVTTGANVHVIGVGRFK